MSDAHLSIKVTREGVDEAARSLYSLTQAGAGAEVSFKSLAMQIAGYTSVANLAVQVGQKVISGIADITKESIVLAASFEKSRMTWGVLVNDMQKGSKVFDQLYAFAAKTPLSFQNVERAAQTLKGMGVATEDLIGVMGKLGDVAMGDDAKLQRVSLVYGQVVAKGKADTRDLWQFVDAGVPIVDMLGQVLGKTGGEILKMTADGKIGFKDVEAAINKATGEGGQFHNLMQETSKTASGQWSTALDNARTVAADFGEKLLTFVVPALKEFNAQMERRAENKNIDKVLAWGTTDVDAIKKAMGDLENQIYEVRGGPYYERDFKLKSLEKEYAELQRIYDAALRLQDLNKKTSPATPAAKQLTPDEQAIEDGKAELRKKFWEIDQNAKWADSQGQAFDSVAEKAKALDKIVGDLIEKGFGANGGGIRSLDALATSLLGPGWRNPALANNMQPGYRQASWSDVPQASGFAGMSGEELAQYNAYTYGYKTPTSFGETSYTSTTANASSLGRHGAVAGSETERTLDNLTNEYEKLTRGVEDYETAQKRANGWTEEQIFSFQILKDNIRRTAEEQKKLVEFQKNLDALKNSLIGIGEQGFVNTFKSLGEAFASGSDAGESLAQSIANVGKSILDQTPMLLLQLAVSAAGTGNWGLALLLLGASGLVAIGSGAADHFADNAQGDVYSSPSLHSYVNGVYSSPKLFNFAKGASFGRFAEAGPEAIMPLGRTPSGALGVQATGGKTSITVVNELGVKADATIEESQGPDGGKQMRVMLRKAVADVIASGAVDKPLTSRIQGSRIAGRRVS